MGKFTDILKWVLQLEALSGYTAKIGGAGLVFSAIASIIGRLTG